MDDLKDPRSYYFSTYHLARDLIGTAAPFTFFAVLAIILFEPIHDFADRTARSIAPNTSWLIVISAVVVYFLTAFLAGTIANRTALALRDFLERSAKWKKRVEYTSIYEDGRPGIEKLYSQYIVDTPTLWVDKDLDLFERVDRLCHLFKLYNPAGFQHLYRDYSFVFMYRQALVYVLLFLGICAIQVRLLASVLLGSGVLVIALAIRAGVREAVHSEYQFIFATASWLERQERIRREEVSTVGKGQVASLSA